LSISTAIPISRSRIKRSPRSARWSLFLILAFALTPFATKWIVLQEKFVPEALLPLLLLLLAFTPELSGRIKEVFRSKLFLALTVSLVWLAALGISRTGDVIGPYADLRSAIVLVFAGVLTFYAARSQNHNRIKLLLVFAVAHMPLGLAAQALNATGDDSSGKAQFSQFAYILVMHYAVFRRNPWLLAISILGLIAASVLSGYRNDWLIAAIAAFSYGGIFISQGFLNVRSFLRSVGLMATIGFVGYGVVASGVIASFFRSNSRLESQTIYKGGVMLEVLQGQRDLSSADARSIYFGHIIDRPWDFAFPHGLGYRSVSTTPSIYRSSVTLSPYLYENGLRVAGTIDSGYYFLLYHYGFVGIAWFLWLVIRLSKHSKHRSEGKRLVWPAVLVMLMYLVGNCFAFSVLFESAFLGIYLGFVFGLRSGTFSAAARGSRRLPTRPVGLTLRRMPLSRRAGTA
jgi:general stress protein CsbA